MSKTGAQCARHTHAVATPQPRRATDYTSSTRHPQQNTCVPSAPSCTAYCPKQTSSENTQRRDVRACTRIDANDVGGVVRVNAHLIEQLRSAAHTQTASACLRRTCLRSAATLRPLLPNNVAVSALLRPADRWPLPFT